MSEPIKKYSDIEIKLLQFFCQECETELVFEGTLDLVEKEIHKLKCPKCLEEYFNNNKPGIVYVKKPSTT